MLSPLPCQMNVWWLPSLLTHCHITCPLSLKNKAAICCSIYDKCPPSGLFHQPLFSLSGYPLQDCSHKLIFNNVTLYSKHPQEFWNITPLQSLLLNRILTFLVYKEGRVWFPIPGPFHFYFIFVHNPFTHPSLAHISLFSPLCSKLCEIQNIRMWYCGTF